MAADWGTSGTKALLFRRVEGRLRLAAVGRAPLPPAAGVEGLERSLLQALEVAEAAAGGEPGAQGPDAGEEEGASAAVGLLSAAPPLRAALLALTGRYSLESARRALSGAPCRLVADAALDEAPGLEAAVEEALAAAPEVLVLAGGMEQSGVPQGMRTLAELVVRVVLALPEEERPVMVFSGHSAVAGELAPLMRERADLWVTANIRPGPEAENLSALRRELDQVYLRRRRVAAGLLSRLAGSRAGEGGARRPVSGLGWALESAVRGWREETGRSVACLSWGAGWLALAAAGPRGVGVSLLPRAAASSAGELRAMASWLPAPPAAEELLLLQRNSRLRPQSAPVVGAEVALELSELRSQAAQAAPALAAACEGEEGAWLLDRLVLGGAALGDGGTLPLGPTLLAVLDALGLAGVVEVRLDPWGVLAVAGALLSGHGSVELLEGVDLLPLGTLVAPLGRLRPGQPALGLSLQGEESSMELDGVGGQLERLPWKGEARMTASLRRGLSLGGGQGPWEVQGGELGLVLDLRGRPLGARPGEVERRTWLRSMGWEET